MTPQNKHKKLPKNAAKIADAFQHYGYKQGYSEGFKAGREEIIKGCLISTSGFCSHCSALSNNPQDE
jgi:hypothetical protein